MNNLDQIVNPIYTTAKGTVMMLAAGGDKDAIALCPYLDLDEIKNGKKESPPEIRRGDKASLLVILRFAIKR